MPLHHHHVGCIERIAIHSQWIGFGDPCFWSEDLDVVRRHGQFTVNGRIRRTGFDREAVARPGDMGEAAPTLEAVGRFLLAIDKPPLEHPRPEDLGMDLHSLRPLARDLLASTLSRDPDGLRLRRAGFSETDVIERLCDPPALRAALASYYRGEWTDDYPEFAVRLGLVGGAEILLESKSQKHFMLPWRIECAEAGPPFVTFDADVSRALADCVPEDFLNRMRLLGWASSLSRPLPEEIVRLRLLELGRDYSLSQRLRRFLSRWFGRCKA